MKITVVAVSTEACRAILQCRRRFEDEYPQAAFSLRLYPVARGDAGDKLDAISEDIRTADIAIADLMGCGVKLVEAVGYALDGCAGQRIVIGNGGMDKLRIGGFTRAHMRALADGKNKQAQKPGMMEKMRSAGGKMPGFVRKMLARRMGGDESLVRDLQNFGRISDYWLAGTEADVFSMLLLLFRDYFGMTDLPVPQPCTRPGDTYLTDLAGDGTAHLSGKSYLKAYPYQKGRPWVVLLYHGHNYPTRTEDCVEDIAKRLHAFANVAPIAFNKSTEKDMTAARRLVQQVCGGSPALVFSFMPFRLGAGPMGGDIDAAVQLLKDWNAPCLHPYILTKQTDTQWEENVRGAGPGEFLINIMMPELDGMIETLPVGALRAVDSGAQLDKTVLLPQRADALCRRVRGWLALQSKSEEEKKIALVCYNYPPGEGNLFGGAFLDTLASLEHILRVLAAAGYTTETPTAGELEKRFVEGGIANSPCYTDENTMPVPRILFEHYEELMQGWPTYERMTYQWGQAKEGIMAAEDGLLVPGISLGNVFIGLQPARTQNPNDAGSYHDRNNLPHHQYAAFYRWLTEEWGADAVVYVGTHGSLEFLPGKETGLSGDDAPDWFTGDVPNIYLYYVGNPSEAMIAKRRSRAVCVGYAPPPFEQSGLYGGWAELEATLHELAEAEKLAPQRVEDLRRHATEQCRALGLPEDARAAERELYRMRTAMMPKGLHVFGGEGGKGESEGLLRALRGEYIEVALAGDSLRSAEVLPGGRNLYQFDPRYVPSPTAMERGRKAAEGLLEKYKNENGVWPKHVALILWGLETSRTQGETVGQILALLGARLAQRKDSYESRFELIPLEELGRPRIDVTINICGFFRDMFPNLLTGFYELFEKLAGCAESEEDNYYLAGCRRLRGALLAQGYEEPEAQSLCQSRIFGPKEGEYGTSLTDIVSTGAWQTEEQLALNFTDSLDHVYNEESYGRPVQGLLQMNYSAVDIVSQIRSDAEYELVDLDHYYEFYGGLAKSVSLARGTQPAMYITDTTGAEPATDTAQAAIRRGVQGRLLNPKYINGLLAHGYHGAQKLESRFENMLGLAATTGAVDTAEFDALYHTFVEDDALRARLQANNPAAYMKMLERLMESNNRGYWEASDEMLERLTGHILEAEGMVE